jgi:hypothetical protein
MPIDASYLRDRAQYCVALARDCPHLPTAQALEALGVELMEKAATLDEDDSLAPRPGENPEPRSRRR